jgi:hypothetical protein
MPEGIDQLRVGLRVFTNVPDSGDSGRGAGITQSAPLGTRGAVQVTEHVPETQERSESHVEPQQGSASAPQATHVPFEQVAPDAQASFAQQTEPFAPQLTHIP